jgi:cytochrome b561
LLNSAAEWLATGRTHPGLIPLPSPLTASRSLAEFLEEAHELAANVLVALALLHAGAAIFHQYILRDHLLERMTPGGKTP